jgi:AbrB family looped-hinge helix DNA binding protein
MITTKVGRRGQVTIPSQVRKQLGLAEGDAIVFIPQEEYILIKPVTKTLLDIRGTVQVTCPQDFDEIRHQVRQQHAREENQ